MQSLGTQKQQPIVQAAGLLGAWFWNEVSRTGSVTEVRNPIRLAFQKLPAYLTPELEGQDSVSAGRSVEDASEFDGTWGRMLSK